MDSDFIGCSALEKVSIGKAFLRLKVTMTLPFRAITLFYFCKGLREITVDSENPNFYSENGILFDKESKTILTYPAAKSGDSYSVPKSVTTIAYGAFAFNKNLVSLTLPDGLKEIDEHAFREVERMNGLEVPESVQEIKAEAVHNNDTLKKVTIYGERYNFR